MRRECRLRGATTVASGRNCRSRPPHADAQLLILATSVEGEEVWTFSSHLLTDYQGQSQGICRIGKPKELALSLKTGFSNIPTTQFLGNLRGVGGKLWESTPSWFRDVYWETRRQAERKLERPFSLQIISHDISVPWEYMRPRQHNSTSLDMLILEHPVARRLVARGGNSNFTVPTIPSGRFAVIAPSYLSGKTYQQLARRDAVIKHFRRQFNALSVDGVSQALIDLLKDQRGIPIATLFYYGHGSADPGDLMQARLIMEDAELTAMNVAGEEPSIGRKYKTFCVLTACDVGTTTSMLAASAGWPTLLLDNNFGGVLAPLWQIDPSQAFDFCKELFRRSLRKRFQSPRPFCLLE